jgi:hypothetical protein
MARPGVQGEAIPDYWLPLLDEELSRLPENYRLPIVLCDLEGKTRREAADRLGWPEGTVAGRLARGRALLARRLLRHGGALSSCSVVAGLAQNAASACVSEALVHSTARAASLLAAGTGAAGAVISARVAALTEGVVRAMSLAKLKTVTGALALTVLIGLGGVALVPGGGHLPAAGAAAAPQKGGDAKPDAEAQKLVRQLGSDSYAEREAAEKALVPMGARAAASVGPRMGDANLEVARRCARIWPRLWQAEIDRKDADRLAGYAHPLWARFRKAAGDDPGSRTLFAEMVADFKRFRRLEDIEADPKTAAAAYTAELKHRAEALERGYGIPTRGQFATLLFLGTYPATAKDEGAANTHNNVFAGALGTTKPPALRRLYAAWLKTRTDPQLIAIGLNLAVNHSIAEAAPVAVAHASNDKLAPRARAFALLAVGRLGKPADLPVLKQAFLDSRVFHTFNYFGGLEAATRYGFLVGRRVEVRVSDTAVAAALWLAGQEPADFGFTFLERHKMRGPDILLRYQLLGFLDDAARQAAHKKAREWLARHGKGKPRKKP